MDLTAEQQRADRRAVRRMGLALGSLVFVTYAYFYNGASWNQNARLDSIYAFVEPGWAETGTFRIDRFLTDPVEGVNTGDWSKFGGHYYSNKAPGTALLGVPFYFAMVHLEQQFGIDSNADTPALLNAYAINLYVSVLPMAVSAGFFFALMIRLGCSMRRSLWFSIALYWGSLCFPFSTNLWGHTTAAAFVVLAYYGLVRETDGWLAFSGLAAGLSVLTEYSCAFVVLAIGVSIVATRWREPRALAWFVVGGFAPLIVYAIYHAVCFGSPFAMAPDFNNPIFVDPANLGGAFGLPTPERIIGLTFSPYRGVFFYMPHLILTVVAVPFVWGSRHRVLLLSALASALCFAAMNIGFDGWHGGSTVGPRYLIPALPLCVIIATALPTAPVVRVAQRLLLAPSLIAMLLIALCNPMLDRSVKNPLLQYLTRTQSMLASNTPIQREPLPIRLQSTGSDEVATWGAFNWGERLGLHGVWTLGPWVTILGAGWLWIFRRSAARRALPLAK